MIYIAVYIYIYIYIYKKQNSLIGHFNFFWYSFA